MNNNEELVELLKKYNESYRKGKPLVDDKEYDLLVEKLRSLSPSHPYLATVEPETFDGKIEIRHPEPMLSIDKAYTSEDLSRFIVRVKKAAEETGVTDIKFKITAKLDGIAGRDDGKNFATRGNGITGYEISSAFEKGIEAVGGRGQGLGEIVILKSYFDENLKEFFEHPRNMVAGIIASDKINENAVKALKDKAVQFVPYSKLPYEEVTGEELLSEIENISEKILKKTDYPVDGIVAGIVDKKLKDFMGATNHHYRWQIAYKTIGETATATVEKIVWQTGRTGNVTPVLEIQPVKLSGATIRRVTAHNAGNIKKIGVGVGSKVEIIRSGEVIPKIIDVISTSDNCQIPEFCPVCGEKLSMGDKFLKCLNDNCDAKIIQSILHWFKTIGNADWFGIKSVEKLVSCGKRNLIDIYEMKVEDFIETGFGPVQSKNFEDAIKQSIEKKVEDWRFLAAFGINNLGKGDSRKLLSHFPLNQLVDIKDDDIKDIHGFGDITSKSILEGLKEKKNMIQYMLGLKFNLESTPLITETKISDSPLHGKKIVFSGKMLHGKREDIQAEARLNGVLVQTAVSSKTDYLVCGEKTGAKKIDKAKSLGVTIITENEYLEIIHG